MQSTGNKHMCLVGTTRYVTREIIDDMFRWNKRDQKRRIRLGEISEEFPDKLVEETDEGTYTVSLKSSLRKRLRKELSRELAKIPGIIRRRKIKEKEKGAAKLRKAEKLKEKMKRKEALQEELRILLEGVC
ncbi:MAG: uncharacterized protein A8A55_2362 [Amphiamblys sp. WSBS2006]|nr:MAG: uncharacterized protein A8A55_2362 [Amphiamblys sp. WSBS2006]